MQALKKASVAVALAIGAIAGQAQATIPVYPDVFTPNPALYTFTAATTGDLIAYFTGSSASLTNELGVLVNGVDTNIHAFNTGTASPGDMQNFGSVVAGDTLTFYIHVLDDDVKYFSDKSLNADGDNHVWSTNYLGGDLDIPAGTFVTFEDLPHGVSDYNYADLGFVFSNVLTGTALPEPGTWGLMVVGIGAVGGAMRRKSILRLRSA